MEEAHAFDWIGMLAGALTTISFVPQVLKVWRSRSAEDLSIGMFAVFSGGVLCWLIYGIVKNDPPVVLANAATLALSMSIVVMKIAFDRQHRLARKAPRA